MEESVNNKKQSRDNNEGFKKKRKNAVTNLTSHIGKIPHKILDPKILDKHPDKRRIPHERDQGKGHKRQ